MNITLRTRPILIFALLLVFAGASGGCALALRKDSPQAAEVDEAKIQLARALSFETWCSGVQARDFFLQTQLFLLHLGDFKVGDAGRALRLLYRFGDFVVLFTELFDVSID